MDSTVQTAESVNTMQPDLPVISLNSQTQYTLPTLTSTDNCRVESHWQSVLNSQLVGDRLNESEQICQQLSRVVSCRRRE